MKKRIIIGLLVMALVLTIAVAASATTGSKQINATYRGIMLMVNGNIVTAQPGMGEPFIVDSEGRTYIPVRMAAEALGLNVEWVDWLNAVQITGSASTDELEALRAENASLKKQLEEYQDGESDGDLGDLEENLIDDYDYLVDVEIDDISLDGDEDDVDVTIEVDLGDYEDEWADLDDSDIEDFLKDLVSDIQDEFSDDTVVDGVITDIDSDDDLVEFYKDGDEDLEVDYYDEDYRDGGSSGDEDDVIDELEDDTYYVGPVEFEMSLDYDDDDDSVSADLDAFEDGSADDWDDMSSSEIEDDVIEICEDIASAFDDDADISLDTIEIKFYDENGDELNSYEYDVDDEELDEI
ncbi:stalk domain-containing protein [Pelotomaculum propionicicum]|uniref:stalk domain-containing protein n=2 Tax=Pelotomaculum propionicicum TaxID=258475 RepID=UPI003B764728